MSRIQIVGGNAMLMLSALLLSLFASVAAFGQENTGSIQGVVKDSAGAAIAGAKVTISSSTLVRALEGTTDREGTYIFPRVPPGIYTVTISQTGFKTVKSEDVTVVLGQAARIDAVLTTGEVTESVTVNATSEILDVTSSKVATNITETFIDKTPRGRNFHSLLVVAPGVRAEPKSGSFGVGGIQVNGASGSENTFIIDGVSISDIRRGGLRANDSVPFEFLREVQVKSAGFEAEYGGTLGGVVNAVTKSGGNEFHGEGYMQFTGAAFNSSPRGTWQRNPTNQGMGEFFRGKEDEYRTLYPGFNLGGPILKDRLHFFTGYSPEVRRTERTVTFTGDGSTRTANQRAFQHYGIARLDYSPTNKIQVNTSFFWNPQRISGGLYNRDGRIAPPSNDLSATGGFTPASNYTASFNYTPTSNLILSARYGYKYLNDKGDAYGKSPLPYIITQRPSFTTDEVTGQQIPVVPGIPEQYFANAGTSNVTSTFQALYDVTDRHNIYLDANYIKRIFGQQHSIKGGYAINRISNRVKDDYTNGRFEIFWNESFTRGSIVDRRGTYGYYRWEDGVRHDSGVNSRNQAFYLQDAWQIHPRVTINAGVRFENEFLPPFVQEVNGTRVANPISFGWGDKIAPLIGGAWDITGTGKWKLSASYGEYFDLLKYELARGAFGGDFWHSHVYTLDSPDLLRLSKATPGALGTELIDIDNRTIPINSQGLIDGVDPGIKPMSTRQFSIGLDHEFKRGLVASMRWTRSRLVRGIEDIGTLDENESEVYVIGNPGFGLASDSILGGTGQPLTPKARRDYDGVEFRVDGRFSQGLLRRFNYNVSYTWSRLYGNWAGLANSDENGRSDPNVSRAFDLYYGNYDSNGNNVYGLLATDRPHTFKFFGNYDLPWRAGQTTFSLSQLAFSGTPLSSEATIIVPVFYNGRGDLGRTPALTQTDLQVYHLYKVSERVQMKFSANVVNLFNQAAVTDITQRLNRNQNLPCSTDDCFFNGFNAESLVNPNGINPATGMAYPAPNLNPIYRLPFSYQGIREIRFGFNVIF
jgi:Carboxypeptidase regulatory-like domain/TonB-dependent Receptor Plug Domain/TonB dependent receptor